MKKLLAFLFFSLFASTLFAFPNFKDGRLWHPTSSNLGFGNDKWTFGFSRNNDDQLSYSTNILLQAPIWTLSVDANGITNRGWKDAWCTGDDDNNKDNWYDGRYDVIDCGFSLKLPIWENDDLSINIEPKIGFALAGNLNFVFFQNLIHRVGNIHQVFIDYEAGDKILFAPKLSALAKLTYSFPLTNEGTKIGLSLNFQSENNINFETTQYFGCGVSLYQEEKPFIALSLGRLWMQGYTGWKTQELFHKYNEGWQLGFKFNIGAFSIDYYKVLNSSFGYNIYSVDVMSFFEKCTYKESDLTLSVGLSRAAKRNYNLIRLSYDIYDSNLSAILTSRYFAGNPISAKKEEISNLKKDWRLKLAYASWALGINYDFISQWSKEWVRPYINFSLGLQRFELAVLTNMVPSSYTPGGEIHNYLMFIDLELGLTFLPKGLLKAENATYQFFLNYGLSYYPDSESLTNYIQLSHLNDFFNTDFTKEYYFLHRISFGITIGLDL